jgi:hypothetical protein
MKLIKSLMGRRQFLTAAGLGSASALALAKLKGTTHPVLHADTAAAAESGWPADLSVVSTSTKISCHRLKSGTWF